MQTEIEKVLKVGDLHNLPHWKVYFGNNIKQQQIYCSSEDIHMPNITIDWATTKGVLESYLRCAPEATYTIHFKESPQDKSDLRVMTFRITQDTAAVAGVQQMQPALPPQFMMQNMMQYMTAEIGRVTTEITSRFEKQEMQRQIEELKEKLRKKKESGWGAETITTLFKEGKETFMQLKALKEAEAGRPAIAIGTSSNDVPATANQPAKDKKPEGEEPPPVMQVSNQQLAELYNETLGELQKIFGSSDEVVINLFCLKELMKDKKVLFDTLIVPELKNYRKILDELGIKAGN